MLIFLALLAGFRTFHIPKKEKIHYIAYEKGKFTPIVREVWTENGFVLSSHKHLDESSLSLNVKIFQDSLYTFEVEKYKKNKKVLEEKREKNGIKIVIDGKKKMIKKSQVFDRHTLYEVFRFYNFSNPKKIEIPLLVPEIGVIPAELSYHGKDTVDCPLGRIECYKLSLKIKGIWGIVARHPFEFWYNTKYPHYLIMFSHGKDRYTKIKAIEKQ